MAIHIPSVPFYPNDGFRLASTVYEKPFTADDYEQHSERGAGGVFLLETDRDSLFFSFCLR